MMEHSLSSPALVVVSLLLYACLYSLTIRRARARGYPLPPGPKSIPIVGNLFNMPRSKAWIPYRDLAAKYGESLHIAFVLPIIFISYSNNALGEVMHLHVLGQSIVVLGTAKVVLEYLEKRSAITADKKTIPND